MFVHALCSGAFSAGKIEIIRNVYAWCLLTTAYRFIPIYFVTLAADLHMRYKRTATTSWRLKHMRIESATAEYQMHKNTRAHTRRRRRHQKQ